VGPDEVEAEVTIPEKFEGFPGVAHGGIVAALLDEITWRASVVGRPDGLVVTGRLDMRLRRPVPVGKPVRLHGRLTRRRARTAEAHGEVRLDDGQLAAEAEAVLFDNAGVASRLGERDRLGWKVYPDRAPHPVGDRSSHPEGDRAQGS
jgi:acyl-coenzyme A thioesterase PaaI-like protein